MPGYGLPRHGVAVPNWSGQGDRHCWRSNSMKDLTHVRAISRLLSLSEPQFSGLLVSRRLERNLEAFDFSVC
jgi:hypothetical protein